ncbi:hypothetical protein tinsulaeT_07960 [Thalassotalea insulae]|uniref:Uncharacterized protein n=1 Tax=Thalassotalea insulae TaxID=2056778 RepID=A0ABQ6GNK2_9GAMM|nr:hypothetical protein [Thalassotalea insulae]GLX77456.1 hypothetical protein tinsulaeT_07960 [Thalassotalea insulae]
MKIITLLFTLIFSSFFVIAKQDAKELPPLDPDYVGVHGMVLVSHSSSIYASHLPLYQKPHDIQLLYKIDTKSIPLIQLVRDADLVTIKPRPFNLQRLARGEKLTLTADVYLGHFERGGTVVYENMELIFSRQLYVRAMKELPKASELQEYDVIKLTGNSRIYVHRISQAPSYDHLIHIDLEAGCLAKFRTSSEVPKETELQYKFLNCGTMKPLYYETEDFSGTH